MPTYGAKPQRKFETTGMLEEAASAVPVDDEWFRIAMAAEWRMASGDAHARYWPRRMRPFDREPLAGGVGEIRLSYGTVETIGQSLVAATVMTQRAFELWDEHRVAGRAE